MYKHSPITDKKMHEETLDFSGKFSPHSENRFPDFSKNSRDITAEDLSYDHTK